MPKLGRLRPVPAGQLVGTVSLSRCRVRESPGADQNRGGGRWLKSCYEPSRCAVASEKDIEDRLCQRLRKGVVNLEMLVHLPPGRPGAEVTNLASLVAGHPFEVVQDSSIWNTHPGLMVDIIGGMTPDIVLRSKTSGENRIIIEVKQHARLGHDKDACQLTRYFLHLLATSTQSKGQDIQRAVILAAPEAWFEDSTNAGDWERFTSRFGPLAAHFGIVLAKLQTPAEAG